METMGLTGLKAARTQLLVAMCGEFSRENKELFVEALVIVDARITRYENSLGVNHNTSSPDRRLLKEDP